MGERDRNRQIVERMAERIKQHEARRGVNITATEAKNRAADVARRSDSGELVKKKR